LGDTTVDNSRLNNVKGVVFEIVEDNAFADAVVLVGVFNHWLLEVAFEIEYL